MDKRHAAAIGAVVPPVVEDEWPLYLGNFWKTFNGFMNGYPGTCLEAEPVWIVG